jgi:hypothetical protein
MSNKAVEREKQTSFILGYYAEHPEEMDTRLPQEKLTSIEEKLKDENLEPGVKQRLLADHKQLCFLAYGEDSPEMMRSEISLGSFYNTIDRPESALRHLSNAQRLTNINDAHESETATIAIESGEAHIAISRTEPHHVPLAHKCLKPTANLHLADNRLTYRRDRARARVFVLRGKPQTAVPLYQAAVEALEVDSGQTEELADLCVESGKAASSAKMKEEAKSFYEKGRDICRALDMNAQAEELELVIQDQEEPEPEAGAEGDVRASADEQPGDAPAEGEGATGQATQDGPADEKPPEPAPEPVQEQEPPAESVAEPQTEAKGVVDETAPPAEGTDISADLEATATVAQGITDAIAQPATDEPANDFIDDA